MAIILALIFAIPASQMFLALINGDFSATEVKVPHLVGMTVSEAEIVLNKIDLKYVVDAELFNAEFPAGQIMSHDPPAEMSVKSGNTIKVNVSKGVKEGSVPNLTNKKLDDAIFTLENYGFIQGSVTIESSDLPKDFVVRQSPTPGTPASQGSSVNLVISDGLKLAMISMPNLVGLDIENAKLELTNAGLVLGEVTYNYSSIYALNVVTSQEVEPGVEVARDTPIKLSVSKGEGNGAGTVNLTIPYNQAQNDVFYLSVYVDSTAIIDYQSRDKSAGSETVTLTGQGIANVFVLFDADKVIDKTVNFDTGEIY
jgi:serine/threonine-protein kinase